MGLAACGEPPTPPPPVDRAAVEAHAEQLAQGQPSPTVDPDAQPVEIVLVWNGIGALYRGFFSDGLAVQELGRGLAGYVTGPANVWVRYDSQARIGQIRLQLRPDTRRLPVWSQGDLVRLQDLAPITTALATYRSTLGNRFDVRIASFRVGIEVYRGANACIFSIAGTPPPDGRVVSPCVEINGQSVCGEPTPEGVRFPEGAARTIRSCLDL